MWFWPFCRSNLSAQVYTARILPKLYNIIYLVLKTAFREFEPRKKVKLPINLKMLIARFLRAVITH